MNLTKHTWITHTWCLVPGASSLPFSLLLVLLSLFASSQLDELCGVGKLTVPLIRPARNCHGAVLAYKLGRRDVQNIMQHTNNAAAQRNHIKKITAMSNICNVKELHKEGHKFSLYSCHSTNNSFFPLGLECYFITAPLVVGARLTSFSCSSEKTSTASFSNVNLSQFCVWPSLKLCPLNN